MRALNISIEDRVRAIWNANWLIVEKAISMIIVLAVNILVARHLGPEQYGAFSYILAVVALASPLSTLGINGVIAKELVENKHSEIKIMSTAILFRFAGTLLSFLLISILFFFGVFDESSVFSVGIVLF